MKYRRRTRRRGRKLYRSTSAYRQRASALRGLGILEPSGKSIESCLRLSNAYRPEITNR